MEQLDQLLAGADLTLDDATLDRIDEIVPPGTDTYPPDGAWRTPTSPPPRTAAARCPNALPADAAPDGGGGRGPRWLATSPAAGVARRKPTPRPPGPMSAVPAGAAGQVAVVVEGAAPGDVRIGRPVLGARHAVGRARVGGVDLDVHCRRCSPCPALRTGRRPGTTDGSVPPTARSTRLARPGRYRRPGDCARRRPARPAPLRFVRQVDRLAQPFAQPRAIGGRRRPVHTDDRMIGRPVRQRPAGGPAERRRLADRHRGARDPERRDADLARGDSLRNHSARTPVSA